MVQFEGLIPFGDSADVNTPELAGKLQLVVDSADNDTLKAVDSLGNARAFQSNAVDVILEAAP